MNGEVSDVEAEEHEALQLGQVVVPQLQVEDDHGLALQSLHGPVDVLLVRELAQDVQSVLLHRTRAWRYVRAGRALLLKLQTNTSLSYTIIGLLIISYIVMCYCR